MARLHRLAWIRIEIALLLGALLLAGCMGPAAGQATAGAFQDGGLVRSGDAVRPAGEADVEVRRVLYAQVDAWNRGDIDGFMEGYWRSPDLRFSSGGSVTHGWTETLQRYRARYPDRAAMGRLAFSDIDVDAVGPEAAVVHGRWRLTRKEDSPNGLFTLVFRRIAGDWVIVSDHTSSADG